MTRRPARPVLGPALSRWTRAVGARMGLLLGLLVVTGCASSGNAFDGSPGEGTIEIQILNRNFNDATVHAIRGGERLRLGIVIGKTSNTLRLEWPSARLLRLEIDLLAGRSCVTRELFVDPGEAIYLEIQPVLSSTDCVPTRAPGAR